MAKFEGHTLDHAGFVAIKGDLTAALAAAIEAKLVEMGEDAKGISWFSSVAMEYANSRLRRAA